MEKILFKFKMLIRRIWKTPYEVQQLLWRTEVLEGINRSLIENVIAFAGQLQAWNLPVAANEVINEILGGKTNAPDYYALKEENARLREILNIYEHAHGLYQMKFGGHVPQSEVE